MEYYESNSDSVGDSFSDSSLEEDEELLYDINETESESSDNEDPMTDEESDYDSDIYETIYGMDHTFIENDKITDKYYISSYYLYEGVHLMSMPISVGIFFKFHFKHVLKYLYVYSGLLGIAKRNIEIIKLDILPNGMHQCILKTHWLRLFQKHWRKVYKERERIFALRMQLNNRQHSILTGRYPAGLHNMPQYRGMLSVYK